MSSTRMKDNRGEKAEKTRKVKILTDNGKQGPSKKKGEVTETGPKETCKKQKIG